MGISPERAEKKRVYTMLFIALDIILAAFITGVVILWRAFDWIDFSILRAPLHVISTTPVNIFSLLVALIASVIGYVSLKNRKFLFLCPVSATMFSLLWVVACLILVHVAQHR